MVICTQNTLTKFSRKHYTYINQIFGDITIRQLISETYPSHLQFKIVNADGFESDIHHVLYNPKTNETICSVNAGHQLINVDKNDTLCQSYSLLSYFGKPISTDKVIRQKDMITMYRKILKDERFIKLLDDVIFPANKLKWKLYTEEKGYIPMNKQKLIKDIQNTLDEWEEYGYHYFIGDGKCPSVKSKIKTKAKTQTKTQAKSNSRSSSSRTETRKKTLTKSNTIPPLPTRRSTRLQKKKPERSV